MEEVSARVGDPTSTLIARRSLADLVDMRGHRRVAYTGLRHNIGRTILLGLEILIVADIILTVAIDQTLENAATLGLIVLVRTFLSFSLDIELDGVVPWRRAAIEQASQGAMGDAAPASPQ